MSRLLTSALLLSVVGLISCTDTAPLFERIESTESGIYFQNTIFESDTFHVLKDDHIYNGAGVGVGDLNNDGLQDLVFSANMSSPGIYLNVGEFQFSDISGQLADLKTGIWFSGVAIIDIN